MPKTKHKSPKPTFISDKMNEALRSDLFSDEQSPGLLSQLHIPDNLQTIEQMNAQIEELKTNIEQWLKDYAYYYYKVEAIRSAAEDTEINWLSRLFDDTILDSDDDNEVANSIREKFLYAQRVKAVQNAFAKTALITGYVFLSIFTFGVALLPKFRNRFTQYLQRLFSTHNRFLNTDFDSIAEENIANDLEPYTKELEETRRIILSEANKNPEKFAQENDEVISFYHLPQDINKYWLSFINEEKEFKNLSIATRLLRDIIYHDSINRYRHKPTPELILKNENNIMMEWDNGCKLYKEGDQFILRNNDGEEIFSGKNFPYDQPCKMGKSKLIMTTRQRFSDKFNVHIIDTETQEITTSPNMEHMAFLQGYQNNTLYFLANRNSEMSYTWDLTNNTVTLLNAANKKALNGTEITTTTGEQRFISTFSHKRRAYFILTKKELSNRIKSSTRRQLAHMATHADILHHSEPLVDLNEKNQFVGIYYHEDEDSSVVTLYSMHKEEESDKSYLDVESEIFQIEEHHNLVYCISANDKILAITYTLDDRKILEFYDLEKAAQLNKIDITDDLPSEIKNLPKIHFDKAGNFIYENENFKLAYNYAEQAEKAEEDRQKYTRQYN